MMGAGKAASPSTSLPFQQNKVQSSCMHITSVPNFSSCDPVIARSTSRPFPAQRRGGGLHLARTLGVYDSSGDEGCSDCALKGSPQKLHSLTSERAAATPASVGDTASLWCRRLGLRLYLCFRNAAQHLLPTRVSTPSVKRLWSRATHDPRSSPHSNNADQHEMRHVRPLDETVANAYCTNLVVNSRYTVQNFVFKNLYEQFSRPLNLYFLVVAMLQFISVIAPVNPLSTLLPLLFAFTLTAVKEGYDDLKRHQQDYTYNHTRRTVLDAKNGAWVSRINADIRVGDVLLLRDEEEIPCDVVVLGASSGVYIRTDNLDGEIDLKPRETVQLATVDPGTLLRRTHAVCDVSSKTEPPLPSNVIAALTGLCLECPPASAIIDSFEGCALLEPTVQTPVSCGDTASVRVPLTHHHLLPQSCVLKNVAQVVCVAVYTGNDTKCGMNKREPPMKWAQIDKDVSRYAACIFACQMLNALIFGVIGFMENGSMHSTIWYLPMPVSEARGSILIYPLRFFLLTTVMIPVSFKFLVDVCKYYMASAVEWDVSMMHATEVIAASRRPESSQQIGCKAKNSSILEDLGQIDYVLSDKTGTLTQNVMELDSVTVCPGHHIRVSKIGNTGEALRDELTKQDTATLTAVRQFAQMVALCNTVEVVCRESASGDGPSRRTIAYHGASPDEVALCLGMQKLGVSLVCRNEHCAVLRMRRGEDRSHAEAVATLGPCSPGDSGVRVAGAQEEEEEELTWTVHHTFEFTSERRTMGIIVEEPFSSRIWFIVKGADDRVMQMASPRPPSSVTSPHPHNLPLNPECASRLSLYAHHGLRTLLVACKELTRKDLGVFLRNVAEVSCLTEGRKAYLDALRAQMESDVTIMGITAIEDKLQEDVGETINDMLIAGIKVWMLTGDKMETAEQIAMSCGLYRGSDMVIRIGETQPATDFSRSTSERGGASTNARNWREELLTFPMERLPPPPSSLFRQHSITSSFVSSSAAQMCGKALETRVLCFDASDSSQFSNEPLRTIAQAADSVVDGSGNGTGGSVFVSGGPQRIAVLIVEGGAVLESILQDRTLRARFREIASCCSSVICARSTPSQKAAIVRFVREGGFMTLSVGDGGNDVAMLQEAHVGVGISGKEGQQAARAADFSITQFSDLRALLFVHGQQAYTRSAYVIKYSFYKSMLISFIQLAYNVIGTHVSGGTFWNSFSLTMWNGFYTLPQTIFYCFDRCAPRVVLERNPYLYKMTRHALDIRPGEFFGAFVVRGILQSVGLLWLSTRLYGPGFAFADGGGTASNDVTFSVSYTALMLSQVYTVWWESHAVTPLNLLMLLGMPVFYVYSTSIYSDSPTLQYFGVFRRTLDRAGILSAFGVSVALVVPSIIFFTVMHLHNPNPRDVLRRAEICRQQQLLRRKDYKRMQSFWVRWLGAIPEDSSMLCWRGCDAQSRDGDSGRDSVI